MKHHRFAYLLVLCAFVIPLYAQSSKEVLSDSTLYTELTAAYNSHFYPGVIRYADRLAAAYPQSALTRQATVLKGESLFLMGQVSEAATVLIECTEHLTPEHKDYSKGIYWLGRSLYAQKKYDEAVVALHTAAKDSAYKASALLYAGLGSYALDAYDTAIPVLSYVVEHQSLYDTKAYTQAVLALSGAYSKTQRYDKLIALYNSASITDATARTQITFDVAQAYAAHGNYQKAYDLYCSVLESHNPQLAARALPKAYTLSVEYKNQIHQDTGAVLALVQDTLAEYPALVAEFWIRLGIDAYNAGAYAKTLEYFDQAQEQATRTQKQLMALYQAEIDCAVADKVEQGALLAAERLLQAERDTLLVVQDALYVDFQLAQAEKASVLQNWGKCRFFAQQVLVQNPRHRQALYWKALAEYNTANYTACIQTLEIPAAETDGVVGTQTMPLLRLYAGAYAKTGNTAKALALYQSLATQDVLDDDSQLDYAKLLFLSGEYGTAYTEALNSDAPSATYVAGLSACNDQRWKESAEIFREYLATASDSEAMYKNYALFYLGYAQYRMGNFEGSYKRMQSFIQKNYTHELLWNAYIISAQAAVQLRHFDDAARAAESAITQAASESRKEEATILAATIYADSGNYTKALVLLEPASLRRTTFGRNCSFLMAQMYAKQGSINRADEQYMSIVRNFAQDPLAQEALYLRAELYYTHGLYKKALERFTEYSNAYPTGSYADASLYYQANAFAASAQNDDAIMRYTMLLDHYPQSTYRYAALKNVAALYRQAEEYSNSIDRYNQLIKEFEVQAKSDGIPQLIAQVQLLQSGSDEALVAALQSYEQQGKESTPEGRAAGTTLAALYFASGSKEDTKKGLALAERLLALQKKNLPTESVGAADNAAHIALQYRTSGKEKESAALYLQAAEYYRLHANHSAAAQSLYSAVEAFDAAALYDDSRSAAKTLHTLYPNSVQNAAAEKIITR